MTTQLNNSQMKILLHCVDQIKKAHNMDCDKWILDGTNFKNIGDYQSVCQLNHNDDAYTNAIKDITYEGNKVHFVDYTVTSNYQNSYLPEINYNRNKNCFTVCCYSHGNMTPDEFEKFLKAQQQGLELAKFLTQVFCVNPTEEEEDD